MKFTTTTGSVYEVEGTAVRRLYGSHAPTERQGEDGQWREYHTITQPTVGEGVVIVWKVVDEGKPGWRTAQCTWTSDVVLVDP